MLLSSSWQYFTCGALWDAPSLWTPGRIWVAQAAAPLQFLGLNSPQTIPFPGISEAQLRYFHTKPNNFCSFLQPLCSTFPRTAWTGLWRDGDWEKHTDLSQCEHWWSQVLVLPDHLGVNKELLVMRQNGLTAGEAGEKEGMVSNSPWNKLLSGCEFLRKAVGEPRVWDGAGIPITPAAAHCPRGDRTGTALPALLHPWQVDGNSSWVCSSRTRPFQLCSLRDSLGRAPWAKGSPAPGRQGGKLPLPWGGGAGGWG